MWKKLTMYDKICLVAAVPFIAMVLPFFMVYRGLELFATEGKGL